MELICVYIYRSRILKKSKVICIFSLYLFILLRGLYSMSLVLPINFDSNSKYIRIEIKDKSQVWLVRKITYI